MDEVDGYDLLVNDLDTLEGVEDYSVHDERRVLVKLKDGRRFMLTAEEQSS